MSDDQCPQCEDNTTRVQDCSSHSKRHCEECCISDGVDQEIEQIKEQDQFWTEDDD